VEEERWEQGCVREGRKWVVARGQRGENVFRVIVDFREFSRIGIFLKLIWSC
jgi:hypothetical protein